ncbi:MAG: hypothetical protein AB1640_06950 [bacterium]
MSRTRQTNGPRSADSIPVSFTLSQRDLILGRHQGNIPLAPLVDEETFRAAVVEKNSVVVHMPLYHVEHLMGFVAGDANHTRNRRLARQLDELFLHLQSIVDRYS